jgi:hypothetical protein
MMQRSIHINELTDLNVFPVDGRQDSLTGNGALSDWSLELNISPPSSKEAFQKLRSKYHSALSVLASKNDKVEGKVNKSRRRQSFAIAQMLNEVKELNSTPLKISALDGDKMVESLRKITVNKSAAKVQVRKPSRMIKVPATKNINDIFESQFGTSTSNNCGVSLTSPTPYKNNANRNKVLLLHSNDADHKEFLLESVPGTGRQRKPATPVQRHTSLRETPLTGTIKAAVSNSTTKQSGSKSLGRPNRLLAPAAHGHGAAAVAHPVPSMPVSMPVVADVVGVRGGSTPFKLKPKSTTTPSNPLLSYKKSASKTCIHQNSVGAKSGRAGK